MLDDDELPLDSAVRPRCAWLVTRRPGQKGMGQVMVIGPNLCKVTSNIPKEVVAQWVKDAPRKSTLWTPASWKKQLPKLFVVLEEWTTPTWHRLTWGNHDSKIERTALGLLPTSSGEQAPTWQYLVLRQETTLSNRVGNGQVLLHFGCKLSISLSTPGFRPSAGSR
jgi:hypothetical protein